MRALLQRVTHASVEVGDEVVGSIDRGVVTFLGVRAGDGLEDSRRLADRIANLRIFPDAGGRFHHSLLTAGGACLLVPQFTLLADTGRGRRPDFRAAAPPDVAVPLIEDLAARLGAAGVKVAEGRFGAHMLVRLVNDGPVTILLDSRERV